MIPFPSQFPSDAVPVLVGFLRKEKSLTQTANAAWNVVGWFGTYLPSTGTQVLVKPVEYQVANEADELERGLAEYEGSTARPAGAQTLSLGGGLFGQVFVGLLAKVARRVVEEWLRKATGGTPTGLEGG